MRPNKSKLEPFLKKVGNFLHVNYRFHRYRNYRSSKTANAPRVWQFEWWKRIPGNPLNKYSQNNIFGEPPFKRSEYHDFRMPDSILTKDEAIEYVLFKSDFLPIEYGSPITSYDELNIVLDLANIMQ